MSEQATFWEHVEELRQLLLRSLCVVGLATLLSLTFVKPLMRYLTEPIHQLSQAGALHRVEVQRVRISNPSDRDITYALPRGYKTVDGEADAMLSISPGNQIEVEWEKPLHQLVWLGPLDGILLTLRISLRTGLAFSAPIWLYFILRFLSPALEPAHRRVLLPFFSLCCLFLGVGAWLALTVTTPLATRFLYAFDGGIGVHFWSAVSYTGFVLTLILAQALAFQLVVLLLFLVHLRVVNSGQLRRARRAAILAIFVLSALLTPPDVLTQCLLAFPLLLLYEAAILYAKLRTKQAALSPLHQPPT